MQKLPPMEKIYEAYSAIADGRVTLEAEHAVILSSNKAKEYMVSWNEAVYAANDNGTYWQGYPGYPIIAVLMLQGKLPWDERIAELFSGINWIQLNKAAKGDYAKAVDTVFQQLDCDDDTRKRAREEVEQVYESLKNLDIDIRRGSARRGKHIDANRSDKT